MNSSAPRACLMGYPVAQSRSPLIHGYWLKELGIAGGYDLQEVTPEAFPDFLKNLRQRGYVGGNITVPHKEAAYQVVDERDGAAERIGAVNTVWYEGDKLMGGNSDAHGFLRNLDNTTPGWDAKGGRALILGAGGAARAASYDLVRRGFEVSHVNRTVRRAEDLAHRFGEHVHGYGFEHLPEFLPETDLLVNCTPLGMIGKPALTIDLSHLKSTAIVYDVVYVPLETPLLAAARRRGHRIVDGLGMLLEQAGYGFQKWFGGDPRVTPELRKLLEDDIRAKTVQPAPTPLAAGR